MLLLHMYQVNNMFQFLILKLFLIIFVSSFLFLIILKSYFLFILIFYIYCYFSFILHKFNFMNFIFYYINIYMKIPLASILRRVTRVCFTVSNSLITSIK